MIRTKRKRKRNSIHSLQGDIILIELQGNHKLNKLSRAETKKKKKNWKFRHFCFKSDD